MFSMPMKKIGARIRAVAARTHNMPENMRRDAIQAEIDAGWDRVMGKAEAYVQGGDILETGGHFSTLSMGNWHTLCAAAGVEVVPSRVVAVVNPIQALDIATNGVTDDNAAFLTEIANGIQDIAETEILRFDTCASNALKAELTLGRGTGGAPATRGWFRAEDGTALPSLPDERIVSQMVENPENATPVWVREWVEPVMMPGNARAGYQAAMMPGQALDADVDLPAGAGDLFPCEWRVFVEGGEIVAIGNYYPQIARGRTAEDEEIALAMVAEAKAAAQRLLGKLAEISAIPHHPRYEDRDGLNPDGVHFSLDFLEIADGQAPHCRRLVMIEGGPAHLRAPAWGAHPVSFGVHTAPRGIALSVDDIRPRAALDAL